MPRPKIKENKERMLTHISYPSHFSAKYMRSSTISRIFQCHFARLFWHCSRFLYSHLYKSSLMQFHSYMHSLNNLQIMDVWLIPSNLLPLLRMDLLLNWIHHLYSRGWFCLAFFVVTLDVDIFVLIPMILYYS